MPIESSQSVSGSRPLGAIDARIVRTGAELKDQAAGTTPASTTPTPAASATYQPSEALDPGSAPVDTQRVQVIRHAIETGSYPVIPTKIADAMIAAGLLLRAQA